MFREAKVQSHEGVTAFPCATPDDAVAFFGRGYKLGGDLAVTCAGGSRRGPVHVERLAVSTERPSNIRVAIEAEHLVHVTFPESVADEDLQGMVASVREVFKARRRIVLLVDATDSGLSAGQRRLLIRLMRDYEDDFRHWVHSSALVVRSALARGTLTALLWMMTPPYEQKVFSSLEEARSWSERRRKEIARTSLRAEPPASPRR